MAQDVTLGNAGREGVMGKAWRLFVLHESESFLLIRKMKQILMCGFRHAHALTDGGKQKRLLLASQVSN